MTWIYCFIKLVANMLRIMLLYITKDGTHCGGGMRSETEKMTNKRKTETEKMTDKRKKEKEMKTERR